MLNGNNRCFKVHGLNEAERLLIYAFLQGAVYRRCNEQKTNDWFAARDLVGDRNDQWQGTPLIVVYNRFRRAYPHRDEAYAEKQAGKTIGHMLKRVIVDDKRTFETSIREQVRHYKWTGEEDKAHKTHWLRRAYSFASIS